MITYEMIHEAQEHLIKVWGEQGKKVIAECAKVTPFNGDSNEFLDHCLSCGCNWTGMMLTGIRRLYPAVWDAIPDDLGFNAWTSVCYTLILCGVDTSE